MNRNSEICIACYRGTLGSASKAYDAKLRNDKTLTVWNSGKPPREFAHVDDMANGCVFLMKRGTDVGFVNFGCGTDVTHCELAKTVTGVVGFTGPRAFGGGGADSAPRKLLDISRRAVPGWNATIGLREGVARRITGSRHAAVSNVHRV